MINTLKENMKKYISGFYIETVQSSVILIVGAIVFAISAATMSQSSSFSPEQLSYYRVYEQTGYTDSDPQGVFSFGPYINLPKGNYRITIYYETDTDTVFDICYKIESGAFLVPEKGPLKKNKNNKTIIFCNEQDIRNESLQVRTHYQGTGFLRVKGISLGHFFHFDNYMFVTLLTMIISLVFICGKRLSELLERPGEMLCFVSFYTVIACLCLYAMAYSVGQEKLWIHSVINILVVLHACGSRKGLYVGDRAAGYVRSAVCYAFQFGSLYWLDRGMRGIVADNPQMVYSNNTPYLFTYGIIAGIVLITASFRRLWAKRVFYGVVYFVFAILLMVQNVYYQVFARLFSFRDMQLAGEGGDYAGYVFSLLDSRFWLVFMALVATGTLGIFLCRYTLTLGREWKIAACAVIVTGGLYVSAIYTGSYGSWNSFEDENYIYDTMHNREGAFKLCGFYQYELRDLKKTILKDSSADEEQMAKVTEFFESRKKESGQSTNSMTGIFEGKNVIFVLMESIDDIACREDVMPTLYRMSREGISFSNMYASIFGSAATMNSETVTNIGCYAPQDGSVIYSFSDNYFPWSLAGRFADAGYAAREYHVNDPEFYERGNMSRAFGYEEYVCFKEIAEGSEANPWIDAVVAEDDRLYQTLVQDEKFFDYLISYTGHLPYGNSDAYVQIALGKHPEYQGLTYSEEINNYFAKARLTDDMLDVLIRRLEEDGLLENTVIVAMGDHYPYGLADKDALYDLSGVDRYEQLLYKVPCVVWTPGMEAMEVDKTACSLDVVPTLVNLMGLGECSMYVGHDIFDEEYEGYAFFADGAWICGDSYYQGKLVHGTMDAERIADMNRKVMEAISANDGILHTDYWRNHKQE